MSCSIGPDIIEKGLVLNLDASKRRSYSVSGTTWLDISGNGNNATLIGGVGYDNNNAGSLTLDGSNHYIELTSNILLGNDFSLSIIYKHTEARGDWMRLFGHSNDSGARYWGVWIPATRDSILWQSYRNAGQVFSAGYNFNLNQIYFIDVTCSGGIRNFYVNGLLISSSSTGGVIDYTGNISKITIGYAGFHTYHKGNIYSAKIYNTLLSSKEILQNFNATKSRFGL